MPRTERQTEDVRVVIHPYRIGSMGMIRMPDCSVDPDRDKRIAEYEARCDKIADDVRRYVAGVGSVSVETYREAVCGYCGAQWTGDGDDFNGGCCSKDTDKEPPSATDRPVCAVEPDPIPQPPTEDDDAE